MILKGNCWVSYFLTHRLRDGYSFTYHLKCYLEENTFFPPFGSVIFKWLRQIGYPGMGFIVKKETALTQKVPILQQRSSFASHFPWPSSFVLTYSSVRKLVKLSAVQFMLNNHTVSGWAPFLFLLSSHLPAHILSAVDMFTVSSVVLSPSHCLHTARRRLVSSELLFWIQIIWVMVKSLTIGEGSGTPLQYSCLENPMGEGAW